ncbi:MAG: lysophospholipid acyltransferase family protein [Planctomycetes bacterium]|nr:lysophospholipid acyltransferase family protein [Planctomycetota bacterium]
MRRHRRLKHRLQYFALAGSIAALRLVPFALRVALCTAAARVAQALVFEGRARTNLRVAFGDTLSPEKRREIRRANARSLGRFVAEIVDYDRSGPQTAARLVRLDESLAHLDEALALGRGVVCVTPHFGNWELFPAHLTGRGYRGAVVGRAPANPWIAERLHGMRARCGVETLEALGPPRAVLRVLQAGGVVGLLPDLDTKRVSGTFVNFFGKPAYTPTGPAALAIAAKAPIVTAYMIPEERGYLLTFEKAILPNPDAPRREEIERLTAEWSRRFEDRIRAHPEHWVWVHDRWATTPEKLEERRRRRMKASAGA